MKKLISILALLFAVLAVSAKNPDPRNFTRNSLGFYGKVRTAVVTEYSNEEHNKVVATKTYTFNAKGNILLHKYQTASGYVRLYDFRRAKDGSLTKLSITENGKVDSYIVYKGNEEILYSYDDFIISVTQKHGNLSYVFDATVLEDYKDHPELSYSHIERELDAKGRLVKETVYTFGEESERVECFYDRAGKLWKTQTYIDGELEMTREFCPGRKNITITDGDGNLISSATVKLTFYN